jgi:stearoyl-CoA desaturase (delta-9 desaturase)
MSATWVVLVAVALTEVAVFTTSIYLHRALAHRSLRVHPGAGLAFRVVLWLTLGHRRQEWVAVHRKHHTFTDRQGDPHSPRLLGFWHVQLFNVVYYIRETRNAETRERFAPDLRPDRLDRMLFRRGGLGVLTGMSLLCAVMGLWQGLMAWLLHAALYVFLIAPLINGLGHWPGPRNFHNTASNRRFIAWITGGESLHNNHHAQPYSAKFSVRRAEFDPSWPIIRLLAKTGALVVKGSPLAHLPQEPPPRTPIIRLLGMKK